jgi:hypothetical protein
LRGGASYRAGVVLSVVVSDVDDWFDVAPWVVLDEEFTSVELWLAETPLVTLWSPLPILMPGLMLAPALISVLLMPTFAFTPTFGFTLSVPRLPESPVAGDDEALDEDVEGDDVAPLDDALGAEPEVALGVLLPGV